MAGQVSFRVVALVRVLPAPLVSGGGQFVGGQRTGTGGEGTGYDDRLLTVPVGVVAHQLGVRGDVLRRELGQLVGLGVDPSEWLHVFEEGMVGRGVGDVHGLVGAPLRRQDQASQFFDLRVVRWADSVEEGGNLE